MMKTISFDAPSPVGQEMAACLALLEKYLSFENGVIIGGGAARALAIGSALGSSDIDIFFRDAGTRQTVQNALEQYSLSQLGQITPTFMSHNSKNATGLSYFLEDRRKYPMTIQLIKRVTYANVVEMFSDFDFTVCQFATDGKTIVATEQALTDTVNMVLRPTGDRSKIASYPLRFTKYVARGFKPVPECLNWVLNVNNIKSEGNRIVEPGLY